MIKLTRRGNQEMILNSDLIETIEETPDTVITLTTGRRHLVCESAAQILEKITEFRADILRRVASPRPEPEAAPRKHPPMNQPTEEEYTGKQLNPASR